ncbi:hypothetical protein [Vibrio paucivorans]|uniref:Uncharacterized protein n=1 Tax=Vibrio paucivorans TaxID=2829489 RepID=A0A9X3HT42_9VIBR|nr:hypothetical protein [Vibrio paucivorans]MCW8335349.1 hypothetical protein [Vibrio paucivorans]
MKKILTAMLLLSQSAYADSIEDYYYYQVNQLGAQDTEYTAAVYLRKSNPCIVVEELDSGKKTSFCKMADSGLDLKRDYPSIYPTNFQLVGEKLYFNVAAPWNGQKCSISLLDLSISCDGAGN